MNRKLFKSPQDLVASLSDTVASELFKSSPIVQELIEKLGQKAVANYYRSLRKEILSEIDISSYPPSVTTFASLESVVGSLHINKQFINGIPVNVYRKRSTPCCRSKFLINLVFPCRNSGKMIKNSIEFLFSEINKSYDIDFNVLFQVNNTSDDTIVHIFESLHYYNKGSLCVNLFILESPRELSISLPGSLNLGEMFLHQEFPDNIHDYHGKFFSFWDDELSNFIPTPDSLFNSNANLLLSSPHCKAISSYMIDNRVNVSRWHEISKGFSSDIRFTHSKPYLHGGGGTVMRWQDFPAEGIESGGIADIDLSAKLLMDVGYNTLSHLDFEQWPVRSNPNAPVFHPTEKDVLKWTTKYLMYEAAWDNSMDEIDRFDPRISQLWKQRIEENRNSFHQHINTYLVNLSPDKILDREFMHFYYKKVNALPDKHALYEQLKICRSRSLDIR